MAPGALRVTDNMRELAQGRAIEGGSTMWELMDVQQRTSPNTPWAPPQLPKDVKPPPLPFMLSEDQPNLLYRSLNHIANHAGEWKFTVRASRRYYDPETKEEWAGSTQYAVIRTLKEDLAGARRAREIADREARGLPAPTSTPPPGTHPLDPEKDYIADIQWSSDSRETWHDVPQKGQPGFPLTVTSDAVTGFRAVKKDPRAAWPDWAGESENSELNSILGWGGDASPEHNIGETVWLQFEKPGQIALDADSLIALTVTCGNTVKRQIRVVPSVEIELECGTLELIMEQPKLRRVQLSANADWQGNGWHPPTKFRFVAEKVKYQTLPLKKGNSLPTRCEKARHSARLTNPAQLMISSAPAPMARRTLC